MQMRNFRLFAGILVFTFVAGAAAHAGTKTVKGTLSTTGVDVPVDLDSDSCFTVSNGATVCTDTSAYFNISGHKSPGGGFTAQAIGEWDPVPGTSCNIGGNIVPGIASCTLAGSNEHGCAFDAIREGHNWVERDNSSGDLLFLAGTDAPLCVNLSSGPPFNETDSFNFTITGGTGENAGATGTRAGTAHGQQLTSDRAGHGFSWSEGSFTDTVTTR